MSYWGEHRERCMSIHLWYTKDGIYVYIDAFMLTQLYILRIIRHMIGTSKYTLHIHIPTLQPATPKWNIPNLNCFNLRFPHRGDRRDLGPWFHWSTIQRTLKNHAIMGLSRANMHTKDQTIRPKIPQLIDIFFFPFPSRFIALMNSTSKPSLRNRWLSSLFMPGLGGSYTPCQCISKHHQHEY